MSLSAYLRVLRERWRVIVIFLLVATGAAVAITALTPKSYQATAGVLVSSNGVVNPALQAQSNAFIATQVNTYTKLITSADVLKYVQSDVHTGLSTNKLKHKISASAVPATAVIQVHVTDRSASRAAQLANSAAHGFVTAVQGYTTSVKLTLTSPADKPSSPTSPKPIINVLLGALLGLVVGAAVAVGRHIVDRRIKESETLAAATAAPVVGVVVGDGRAKRHPVAAASAKSSVRAENYRQLRANVQFANGGAGARVIAVTSALAGEGKTSVAVNLASSLAEAGQRVCLVDANLRNPSVAKALGIDSPSGLTSVLVHGIAAKDALQDSSPNLQVLGAGPIPANPSELLASPVTSDVIRSLLKNADYVIVDTAPLLPVADGREAAAYADGVLLVVRHGHTTDAVAQRAADALRQVNASLIGSVLNDVPANQVKREFGRANARAAEISSASVSQTSEVHRAPSTRRAHKPQTEGSPS